MGSETVVQARVSFEDAKEYNFDGELDARLKQNGAVLGAQGSYIVYSEDHLNQWYPATGYDPAEVQDVQP